MNRQEFFFYVNAVRLIDWVQNNSFPEKNTYTLDGKRLMSAIQFRCDALLDVNCFRYNKPY